MNGNRASRVLVLRHAISEKTLLSVNGGAGLPLSDQGVDDARSQAVYLRTRFRGLLYSVKIVAAPMIHTRQTAELLAEQITCDLIVEERLRSAHMGVLNGLSDAECAQRYPQCFEALRAWRQGDITSDRIDIRGLESSEQFLDRVHAGFITNINSHALTIFVCSRSVANALVAIMRNFGAGKAQRYPRLRFNPGSITEFAQYGTDRFDERYVNDTRYLGRERVFPND